MKQFNIKTLLGLSMVFMALISSCQKDSATDNIEGSKASIVVKMNGIGPEDDSKPVARAATGAKATAENTTQRIVVPFGEDLVVRATLTEVAATETTALRASAKSAATTSTGVGNIIAFNGNYTIRVYKQGSTTLEQTINCIGGASNKFELEPGNYKFVVSAYGNPDATGADKDPLWQEITQTVTAGNNVLDIILKHKLTEVTVKFDAGNGRTINAITNSTVKPNFNYTFDEVTGVVSFGSETAAKAFSFPTQAAGQIWTSSPVMIAVDNSNGSGEVKLNNVTINNKPGNVSLTGLTLRKGVQYLLELNLGAKQGIEVGGEIWSNGNLEYNKSTGEYHFGELNSIGNYWFVGRLFPKVVNGTNAQGPSDGINGPFDVKNDPCGLAKPMGTWRVPTEQEVLNLITSTAGSPPKRYCDNYDKTSATPIGDFFGLPTTHNNATNHPGADRGKYLFMVLAGYYSNSDDLADYGRHGSYMVSTNDGRGFKEWNFYGTKGDLVWTVPAPDAAPAGRAMQIRCVKN